MNRMCLLNLMAFHIHLVLLHAGLVKEKMPAVVMSLIALCVYFILTLLSYRN